MTANPAPRPLLLVLAHGVGEAELVAMRATADACNLAAPAAIALPPHPIQVLLQDHDAARELHDLGVAVDRQSLVVRPSGRTDASAIERIARRATGPAPVTLFEATSVLQQAVAGGPTAALDAARQLGSQLVHLARVLRRGDLPEVWFVGLGAAAPVRTTFDLAAAWQAHVLPPRAHDLMLHVRPGVATITGSNQRALDLVAAQLRGAPFADFGKVEATSTTGQLALRAHAGVAFGRHGMAARAAHPDEARGVFAAPIGATMQQRGIGFAELLARFWMRAAALHVPVQVDGDTTPAAYQPPPIRATDADPVAAARPH